LNSLVVETLHSTFSCRLRDDYLYLIFSCCQLPFCEFTKHITALHYRYDIQMYCTFVLFVNQHLPGLPASGTHCIICTGFHSQYNLRLWTFCTFNLIKISYSETLLDPRVIPKLGKYPFSNPASANSIHPQLFFILVGISLHPNVSPLLVACNWKTSLCLTDVTFACDR
jgi:hypothetical protein